MNKTVNINLGGLLFHIDEDAYQKLTEYLAAIKRSLSNSDGQDEIIKDIEMRIAELISEKHSNDKQIISIKTLDEIIAVMGQPEDYRIDSENEEPKATNFETTQSNRNSKKLYRDGDNGTIGGVAAGLSHYFGIDVVWLRLLWVLLVFLGFGFGFIAYLVLWIVIPKAVTTSEKLEMTGEPITIQNIEKKVREEFENVSEKLKNADYNGLRNQAKTRFEKLLDVIGEIFKGILKIIGLFFIIISIPVLLAILAFSLSCIFFTTTSAFVYLPLQNFILASNISDFPTWVLGLLCFFAIGIPFFSIMLLGFKLVIRNMKSIGNYTKYTLLSFWLLSLICLSVLAANYHSSTAFEGRITQRETFEINPNDTISVEFRHNGYFSKNNKHTTSWITTKDSTDTDVIYSKDVDLKIQKTDEKLPYIQIEKQANGKSISMARKVAEKINYSYTIKGNRLIFDNYFLTNLKNKFYDQEIRITLFLPERTFIKFEPNTQSFIDDDHFSIDYESDNTSTVYQLRNGEVKCVNCNDSDDFDGEDNNDIHVKSGNNNVILNL